VLWFKACAKGGRKEGVSWCSSSLQEVRMRRRGPIETKPSFSYSNPSVLVGASALLELEDGSLILCCDDAKARRLVVTNTGSIELVGSYDVSIMCAVERDQNTLVTGGTSYSLKVWNKTTYECIETIPTKNGIWSMAKTRDDLWIVCGFDDGTVEIRKKSDLSVASSFHIQEDAVMTM